VDRNSIGKLDDSIREKLSLCRCISDVELASANKNAVGQHTLQSEKRLLQVNSGSRMGLTWLTHQNTSHYIWSQSLCEGFDPLFSADRD
jgi:hypothetical protein